MASPDDALALVDLVNMAGKGMPLHLWDRTAGPGQTGKEIGCERARREHGTFSFKNAVVAEFEEQVVAALVAYELPTEPAPIDASSTPAMLVPMQELENLVPGSWYVNFLATLPAYRGQGFGSALLSVADRQAAGAGMGEMSIIVADTNASARPLYERFGYRQVAERAMVKEDWVNPAQRWFLLKKDL